MRRLFPVLVAPILALASSVVAHFPFVVPDEGGATARLVMSETLEPDADVGIGILDATTLWLRAADGRETPLTLDKAENWMTLALPGAGTRVVYGLADLGVMKRGRPHLLIYHPKTILGDPFDAATALGKKVPVELIPLRAEGGFRLRLLVGGKPATGMEVRVITPGGGQADHTTDTEGLTTVFKDGGRYGAWARHWADEAGERDGRPYEQVRRYATLVLDFVEPPHAAPAGDPDLRGAMIRTPLPEAVASFGAAATDGWLYVYGGHKAERHDYSAASVSGRFHRLNLADPTRWEELPAVSRSRA